MSTFWEIVVSNALIASAMAFAALLVGRVWKNPSAVHLVWLVVLLKLFTPPIITAKLPFAADGWPASFISGMTISEMAGTRSPAETPHFAIEAAATNGAENEQVPGILKPESPTTSQRISVANFAKRLSVSNVLIVVWIFGSCLVALGYACRIHKFMSYLNQTETSPIEIRTKVIQAANRLGLKRIPAVAMTRHTMPPLVWSIGLRPCLILPTELFARLSGRAQTLVITHELAHIVRRDYLVRPLELVSTTLFWWHPVVWLARSQLHRLEEECCDSRVLEVSPNQARTYAGALVDTVEFLSQPAPIRVPLPTAVYSTGSLTRRIRMLSQNRTNRLNALSALCVAAIVALPLVFAFAGEAADSLTTQTAVLEGRVTNHADDPLANVKVRVAIPATEMRFIDSESEHKQLETQSDANGEYRLEIPAITKPATISVDAKKSGYRRLAGTLMRGGDARRVKLTPGVVSKASFALEPSIYIKGVIVDEDGKPVPEVDIAAHLQSTHLIDGVERRSIGGVEITVSNSDGTFEIFNYPLPPFRASGKASKGVISFTHPDFVGSRLEDIYSLTRDQLQDLRIVVPAGRRITGTVLDVAGKPVSNLAVKVIRKDDGDRKGVVTDDQGRFVLRGIEDGAVVLRAHDLRREQKAKLPLDLESDMDDLQVRLQDISLSQAPDAIDVLGLRLTDVTPELQSVYDLHHQQGALILTPGKAYQRFEIGELVEGYNFWMVGNKHIGSVREFVEQIIAEADKQESDEYSVRIVYTFSRLNFDGTNTQYMKLTKGDVKQLRQTLVQLDRE